MDFPLSKTQLRLKFKAQRESLSLPFKTQSAEKFSQQFFNLFLKKINLSLSPHTPKNIAVYLPQSGELDLSFLIKNLWDLKQNLYLPLIQNNAQNNSKILKFGSYTPETLCQANAYFEKFNIQILEPIQPLQTLSLINPADLDLILLPLLAFDSQGTRLGMGGGYYDATFSFIKTIKNNSPKKPYLLGCAYEFQQSEILIPKDPWDLGLNSVLTPENFYIF